MQEEGDVGRVELILGQPVPPAAVADDPEEDDEAGGGDEDDDKEGAHRLVLPVRQSLHADRAGVLRPPGQVRGHTGEQAAVLLRVQQVDHQPRAAHPHFQPAAEEGLFAQLLTVLSRIPTLNVFGPYCSFPYIYLLPHDGWLWRPLHRAVQDDPVVCATLFLHHGVAVHVEVGGGNRRSDA